MECSIGCVSPSPVLLKPNVADILLFNFCIQKFGQHGPITIDINCNGLSLLIFEEKWPNYACGFSVPQMRQFCLFKYPPISKWASSEKTIFFLLKSASAISRSIPALLKRIHKHIRSERELYMWWEKVGRNPD